MPHYITLPIGSAFCVAILLTWPTLAEEKSVIRCQGFFEGQTAEPAPREAASVVQRFEQINDNVRSHQYQVLFLGDSLTHRWDEVPEDHQTWKKNFDRFNALNAGVNGDRTEHLLWRIENGNLNNQKPKAVVLLIGTNDLGYGRPPGETAEGIRRVLMKLREIVPGTRLLLEGLWPRGDRARFRAEIDDVNGKIRQCEDSSHIFYADPGRALADNAGHMRRDLAPDGLHPGPKGYEIVSAEIAKALARLLAD